MFHRLMLLVLLLSSLILISRPAASRAGMACTNSLVPAPEGLPFVVGEPAAGNESGPVVLFVHGYTGSHGSWTGSNEATRMACESGYRVAAVDLPASGSIWRNAWELAQKLEAVATYYDVPRVDIVAHSKGGVDSQTATAFFNAFVRVRTLLTLGTPFLGSELADLACSEFGAALGICNEATFTLRTGYMALVRAATDPRGQHSYLDTYMGRGTSCPPFPLGAGCLFIPGPDDGIVSAASAFGTTVGTPVYDRPDLDHISLVLLQNHGPALFDLLQEGPPLPAVPQDLADTGLQASRILRGGPLVGQQEDLLPIEEGVSRLTLLLLDNTDATLAAVAPNGQRMAGQRMRLPDATMLGRSGVVLTLPHPAAGTWRIESTAGARGDGAYLLLAQVDGGAGVEVGLDSSRRYRPNSRLAIPLTMAPAVERHVATATLRSGADGSVVQTVRTTGVEIDLALPARAGSYDLTLEISGFVAGRAFARTIQTSLGVANDLDLVHVQRLR